MKNHLRHLHQRGGGMRIKRAVVAMHHGRHVGRREDARAGRRVGVGPEHGGDGRGHAAVRRDGDLVVGFLVAVVNFAKAGHGDLLLVVDQVGVNGGAALGINADAVEGQPSGDAIQI